MTTYQNTELIAFAEQYIRSHYDLSADDPHIFTITACRCEKAQKCFKGKERESGDDMNYEIDVAWGHFDKKPFRLFAHNKGASFAVHFVDGIEPERVYTLVPSMHRGRYALDDPHGRDIASNDPLKIKLAGLWISGRVEHSSLPTPTYQGSDGVYVAMDIDRLQVGYYFIDANGNVCGLCTGMKVKML